MQIWNKLQVTQIAKPKRANQRPQQNQSGEEQPTMKKRFEFVAREKSKLAVSRDPLRAPKKPWRKQRADQNRREQVNQQSDCIFQGCLCPVSGIPRHLLRRKRPSGKARRGNIPLHGAATEPQRHRETFCGSTLRAARLFAACYVARRSQIL